ncbi:MAG: DUF368 domain-containing protein [Phycisphaerales bacterium]|nr:DUF368 domain-containing protein [Planctomycetota bacterium]MCH8508426.1 DUF368 domain-containing protein [Phycisphaerales bacterium]
MPDPTQSNPATPQPDGAPPPPPPPVPVVRTLIAGAMMGLANLVPGISGGTMLVACGVYRRFIDAVSDATRLRLTRPTVLMLGLVVFGAVLSIGVLAGVIHWALVEHRWVMYALFIGLTWGGAPVLWKMARPVRGDVWAGIAGGGLAMGLLVVLQETGAGGAGMTGPVWLLIAGVAGASAMILPGVSGAFLLLLIGQYEPIIGAIKDAIRALTGADMPGVLAQIPVLLPVAIGVVVGIAGVANALKWVMHRYERPTLGVLLGLLLAAPAGLYPFRAGVAPEIGDTVKGRLVTEENLDDMRSPSNAKDWAQRAYTPSASQVAGAAGLIALGFGATVAISRLGRERPGRDAEA